MDIELLKTFLEVNRTRHFGRAAENLYLTQSAVSARVRLLEETLGVSLFTRTRNDIQLTPAGSRLLKHAEAILNAWNRARQDAALGTEDKVSLTIGGVFSLWDILLQDWIQMLYSQWKNLALQAEAHSHDMLIRKLLDGAVDIAFMFEPLQIAELEERHMGAIKLILVASRPDLTVAQALGPGYVKVDWGTSFAIAHARHFADMAPPSVRVGLGRMALAFILSCGGAAYLAEQMVVEYLQSGRLNRVDGAPVIDREVFAIYPAASERREMLEAALTLLPPGLATPATLRTQSAPIP